MSTTLRGIAASTGVAIGRIFSPARDEAPTLGSSPCANPDCELASWKAALVSTRSELEVLRDKARRELGDLKAEIFEAHLSILSDPDLADEVASHIKAGKTAAEALGLAAAGFIELLEAEGGIFKARADDLRDLSARIRLVLSGGGADPWAGLAPDSVVLAQDLLPSETLRMDKTKVLAILTLAGSANSHSSIIARSMEIPAVVGLGTQAGSLKPGTQVIVDGSAGFVICEPSEPEIGVYARKREAWLADREEAKRFAGLPTRTADGKSLELGANIGGPAEVEAALAGGAEAIGLFRTEFMFMDRASPPGEEEQYVAYRHVLERMGGKPVIIRTLDAGGDKPIAGLKAKTEENPFLGQRAIRFCLAHEDIFRAQLRALLRASPHGTLRIMIPMIAVVDELRAARAILEAEAAALKASGFKLGKLPELGIMIEIPAAALDAERLAREADFFSIGTNDLVQYLMAADRMNPDVAYLNRPLHPAVLRLIGQVAAAAHRHGKRVAVCGEMAADPLALPVLAGLGIHELSMSPALIPAARARLSRLDSSRMAALATKALEVEGAEDVKRLVREELASGGIQHGL